MAQDMTKTIEEMNGDGTPITYTFECENKEKKARISVIKKLVIDDDETEGTPNYKFSEDSADIKIEDGDTGKYNHNVVLKNYGSTKLRIIKKMSKNKRSKAEVGASFTVLDASYTKDIEKQDLGNAQKRIDYINSLDKKAILGNLLFQRS